MLQIQICDGNSEKRWANGLVEMLLSLLVADKVNPRKVPGLTSVSSEEQVAADSK